jgi:uncharacterized RDD family membrane protein YckC
MPDRVDPAGPVRRASFLRRIAAIVYDTLVLIAIEMLATALVLPLAKDDAFAPGNNLYRLYLAVVAFLFFGWFWTHGGQTLGMRAWRLRVVAEEGGGMTWGSAMRRFSGAIVSALPLGLGYLWMLFAADGRTWHDRLSRTRVVYEPRSK